MFICHLLEIFKLNVIIIKWMNWKPPFSFFISQIFSFPVIPFSLLWDEEEAAELHINKTRSSPNNHSNRDKRITIPSISRLMRVIARKRGSIKQGLLQEITSLPWLMFCWPMAVNTFQRNGLHSEFAKFIFLWLWAELTLPLSGYRHLEGYTTMIS